MKQTILGQVPSKSNCYRIAGKMLYKAKALVEYEKNFYIQCLHYRDAKIDGYFEFHIDVYYPNQKADLDNSLKIVLDCLQKPVNAIVNDNKCVKIVARKGLDKLNPRVEFEIIKVEL